MYFVVLICILFRIARTAVILQHSTHSYSHSVLQAIESSGCPGLWRKKPTEQQVQPRPDYPYTGLGKCPGAPAIDNQWGAPHDTSFNNVLHTFLYYSLEIVERPHITHL